MHSKFARIIIDRAIRRELDYAIPESLSARVGIGARVRVPFRDRRALATVVALLEETSAKGIREIERAVARDPHAGEQFIPGPELLLNEEQTAAFATIVRAISSAEKAKPILLHGVTGSGKTEIYLQAIRETLSLNRTAIVLVPEISLTPQTVERFKSRFAESQDDVAVLHSHLSEGERHDEWHKVHSGRARIVIGARSAVFAPLKNLGLIVVDEEHETSYKQEEAPRYHARDVAVVRARIEKCVV